MNTLSEKLRDWRIRRSLTQRAAAEQLGVPVKTLRDWEQSRHSPRGLGLAALLAKIGKEQS